MSADWQFPNEIADEIIERLPEEPLSRILKGKREDGQLPMPSYRAVTRRRANDPTFDGEFVQAQKFAEEISADRVRAYERHQIRIARKMEKREIAPDIGRAMIQAYKVAADNAQWTESHRKAKRHEITGAEGGPIEHALVGLSDATRRALDGLAGRREGAGDEVPRADGPVLPAD